MARNANIQTFADEQFDSIKDVVVEGSINYLGLATTYLTPGASISITGQGYTTGWETLQSTPMPAGLPIASVDVTFNWGGQGSSYITTLHLTNRKAKYTGDVFTRPPTTGQALGGNFGAGYAEGWAKGMGGMLDYQYGEAAGLIGMIGQLGDAARGGIGQLGDAARGGIGQLGDAARGGIGQLGKTGLGVPAAFGIGSHDTGEQDGGGSGPGADPLNEITPSGGGGSSRKSPRVPMPTHPSAGLGQPGADPNQHISGGGSWSAPPAGEHISGPGAAPPGPSSGSSSRTWDAPDESWDQPVPATGPLPAAGDSRAVPAGQPPDPPAAPAAAEGNDAYRRMQGMPEEGQSVIDAERKAAQTAGGSVTGKPYVPTLDEALDNPINRPQPSRGRSGPDRQGIPGNTGSESRNSQ